MPGLQGGQGRVVHSTTAGRVRMGGSTQALQETGQGRELQGCMSRIAAGGGSLLGPNSTISCMPLT